MKSTVRASLLVSSFLVLLTGCITPIPEASRSESARRASSAANRGDWSEAAQLWQKAIRDEKGMWRVEFANPGKLAVYYYELGRCEGVLCQWEAAERDLQQALALDERSRGPVWMDLTELARLSHAQRKFAAAEKYFDRLFTGMPEDQVISNDAPGYVAIVEEAAQTTLELGKTDKAEQLRAKANKVRSVHSNLTTPKDWTPYGLYCR